MTSRTNRHSIKAQLKRSDFDGLLHFTSFLNTLHLKYVLVWISIRYYA